MGDKNSCALILLAAGASTRMGQPKQLLLVDGQPLLRKVAISGLTAPVALIVVVLGANAPQITPCLAGLDLRLLINPDWAEGMGSSLRFAMAHLRDNHPELTETIVALADQPDLTDDHLARLIEVQRTTGRTIVASTYDGVRGPPVLFAARHFPELLALRGDTGARGLLKTHAADVATVPLPVGPDLDTPADYQAYSARARRSEPDVAGELPRQ